MIKKIEEKLYKIWLFREEIKDKDNNPLYAIRSARLNGAVSILRVMGYQVYFNPLAENENPFTVKEKK